MTKLWFMTGLLSALFVATAQAAEQPEFEAQCQRMGGFIRRNAAYQIGTVTDPTGAVRCGFKTSDFRWSTPYYGDTSILPNRPPRTFSQNDLAPLIASCRGNAYFSATVLEWSVGLPAGHAHPFFVVVCH